MISEYYKRIKENVKRRFSDMLFMEKARSSCILVFIRKREKR